MGEHMNTVNAVVKSNLTRLAALACVLMFSAGLSEAATVTLDWDAVTTNEDGTPITDLAGYRLFRSATSLLGMTTSQAMANSAVTKTDIPGTGVTTTVTVGPGTYYFRLTAYDSSGNQSGFNINALGANVEVSTTIVNALPTVSITAPAAGATVSGTAVAVTATAADDVAVLGVQFRIDGVNLGAEDTTAPYSATLNSTLYANGAHTLTAVARDASGSTTSAGRSITISNTSFSACDVDRNSSTNVVDVQLSVNQALSVASCTADINQDASCNVIDVQRIANAALGGACVVGP